MAIWISFRTANAERSARPFFPIELRSDNSSQRQWISLRFIVDTGSVTTVIPIEWISEYGLALNLIEDKVRSFRTSSGSIGYAFRGNVQLRIQARSYSWPCYYSLPPGTTEIDADSFLQSILLSDPSLRGEGRPRPSSNARTETIEE